MNEKATFLFGIILGVIFAVFCPKFGILDTGITYKMAVDANRKTEESLRQAISRAGDLETQLGIANERARDLEESIRSRLSGIVSQSKQITSGIVEIESGVGEIKGILEAMRKSLVGLQKPK